MENMDRKRKNKKGEKGDNDVDGGVLSCENDFEVGDNLGGKKKTKKKKDKGSKKERDECAVSGHAAESEGGDAYPGEMKIGSLEEKNDEKGDVLGEHGESKKNKKKKKKEKRSGKERDEYPSSGHVVENERSDIEIVCSEGKEGENGEVHGEHAVGLNGKTKKRKKEKSSSDCKSGEKMSDADVNKKVEKKKRELKAVSKKKKRKREKESTEDYSRDVVVTDESLGEEVELGRKKRKTEIKDGETKIKRKGKEKKVKQSENTKGPKDKKKVTFSSQVEVFPASSDSRNQKHKQDNLVRGKRFSTEEDKILQEAIDDYIEQHGLGEEGVNMLRNSSKHKLRGCWAEIAKALPHRPKDAIYYRAHSLLLRPGGTGKWSEEDCEMVKKLHAIHGNQWKIIAEEFGRNRYHVKDAWRRLKLVNKQKGAWTQKEYQALFDLVNTDLRLKISEDEEKKFKYGMLRDNIHWTAISDTLTTRTGPNCCMKWYEQLSSPMVAQGIWADSDDHRLINELFSVDASCMEDVDWDNILDHRSGDICRKRWSQMVRHIGNRVTMSFSEQVEILAKRYCPDLIEVREEWENKPYVDCEEDIQFTV